MERSFAKLDMLAVYIDGIQIEGQHVLAAVGLDDTGAKHLLGLARGASENARVVKDLLVSLAKRGIDASRQRLFVINEGTALRSAIEEVYGEQARVRAAPHPQAAQRARALARAAAHTGEKRDAWGPTSSLRRKAWPKLRPQAKWLAAEHPDVNNQPRKLMFKPGPRSLC